jgi:hypothetical protein
VSTSPEPESYHDDIDEAMQRNDFLRVLALALASNGIVDPDPTDQYRLIDCAPILRDIEEQGYTFRLTTHEERRAKNDQYGPSR